MTVDRSPTPKYEDNVKLQKSGLSPDIIDEFGLDKLEKNLKKDEKNNYLFNDNKFFSKEKENKE
jgi:hypothetical protein